jgi:hypothetical protein
MQVLSEKSPVTPSKTAGIEFFNGIGMSRHPGSMIARVRLWFVEVCQMSAIVQVFGRRQ